jgi:hypothetical protein
VAPSYLTWVRGLTRRCGNGCETNLVAHPGLARRKWLILRAAAERWKDERCCARHRILLPAERSSRHGGRALQIRALAAALLLVLSACGGDDHESRAAVEMEGELIPVRGDPVRATYQLLSWSELPNGHRVALTRRDGRSGTSYARREIDCRGRGFRYLGEGDTRQQAEADSPNPGPMAELVPGSISTEISEFVCRK